MKYDYGHAEGDHVEKSGSLKLLLRLLPFIKPYWHFFFISILLIVIITLLDLAIPLVTKEAIDRFIFPANFSSNIKCLNQPDLSPNDKPTRFLKFDLKNKSAGTIISKYPALFIKCDQHAFISFQKLKQLDQSDLITLRQKDKLGIIYAAALLIGIILSHYIINLIRVYLMEKTGQEIMHTLRMSLLAHMLHLDLDYFTKNPLGKLVTRVSNDIQNMHELFTSVIVVLFKDIFLIIGIMTVLVSIHLKLAIITFTILPLVLLVSFYFASQSRNIYRVLRERLTEINTQFQETVSGIRIIQLFRGEKRNEDKFKSLNHEYYTAGITQIKIFAVFMPIIELLGSLTLAIIIFYGGLNVVQQEISLGALVAYISYIKMFFRPIRDMAEKHNIMQNAMASAERIFNVFDQSLNEKLPELNHRHVPLGPLKNIEIKNLSFAYFKNEPLLKNISLQIPQGKTIALIGPTGSGKTTLVNLILGLYAPQSGEIIINGNNLKDIEIKTLRQKLGMVSQDPFLFSGTIIENILYGTDQISEENLERIIEASHCGSIIDKLPQGLDTQIAERGASLSSGERQLISIARAFARNPELIIFDEATSHIDSETERHIQSAVGELATGRTSIIIAHRLSTIRHADQIITLRHGKIIEAGTHNELMAKKGFYFHLNSLEKLA